MGNEAVVQDKLNISMKLASVIDPAYQRELQIFYTEIGFIWVIYTCTVT
jgi:hypothetical protein